MATQVTLSRDKAPSEGQLDLNILQDSNHQILNFKPKKLVTFHTLQDTVLWA